MRNRFLGDSLYRRSGLLCLAILATSLAATSAEARFGVLYSFDGTHGNGPLSTLIADKAGNLYGTTVSGGVFEQGTVFKLAPDGTETVLYTFKGEADGGEPGAGLIQDANGNLFGTAQTGGKDNCPNGGCGVVFEVTSDGTESAFYTFRGGNDGAVPSAGLVADKAGNLYGTTYNGGSYSNKGTLFELQPDGTKTILHSFGKDSDGALPHADLILDGSENLYGTTLSGGDSGSGTVFKVAPDGTETVLYSFTGGSDGNQPLGALIADKQGNLYGTTSGGGNTACGSFGCGVVFKLTPDGTESVLYAFAGGTDGATPYGGLNVDKSGTFYGTTRSGGRDAVVCLTQGCGTIFSLTPGGTKTTLHMFKGRKEGGWPEAGLLYRKGHFYGTDYIAGTGKSGTIFDVTP